jgi:Family of unknown function (DUF5670)
MLHSILWAIIVLLVIFWLLGLFFRIGRCFIHILLVVAIVILVLNIFSLVFRAF